MSNIIGLVISIALLSILLGYGLLPKLYGGDEDLFIDEKVHITILKEDKFQIVPAKIGIEPNLWKDHSLDDYSHDPNNISPLNTKNYNGIVNIESIYDREFTLEDFLDIWGFDKSKIKNIFYDEKKSSNINLPLTDGQHIKLQIENNASYNNFNKYSYQRITFEYPSEWNLTNDPRLPSENLNEGMTLRNETFVNLIKVFPNESKYMNTPFFSILINKLDSNMTQLDEYYKNNLYKLLHANQNTFPHFIDYNETKINNGNLLAYQIFLNTTLVAEPGSSAKGNNITQKEFHIWTLKDGYFYDISFEAFENIYNNYLLVVDKIIESIRFR